MTISLMNVRVRCQVNPDHKQPLSEAVNIQDFGKGKELSAAGACGGGGEGAKGGVT